MRLWPLVIALAGWTALQGLSIAAETPAGPAEQSALTPGPHPHYFAVMGEVAHPGTYAAPGPWTLAELVKRAGGVTLRANRTVRIYRGGVPTGQVYLESGADPALLPGDLVVVARSTTVPQIVAGNSSQQAIEAANVLAVQIGFVNLIDRPVIVKMPSDQATLSRIVELLGQSSDCISRIRVFNPLGVRQDESETSDQPAPRWESGSVLVFSPSSIRMASLPALPAPIGVAPPPAPPASANQLPEFKVTQGDSPNRTSALAQPAQHKVHLTIETDDSERPAANKIDGMLNIAPHVDEETGIRLFPNRDIMKDAGASSPIIVRNQSDEPIDPRPGRTVAIMAAMSAVAGAAMLLTIISIVQRWLQSGKPPFQGLWNGTAKAASRSSRAAIPIPPISTSNLARRPLRIDAGQPITRLSVDLAAIERVTHAKSGR
jgi:SLBB domain